jgi:hypothetical protein
LTGQSPQQVVAPTEEVEEEEEEVEEVEVIFPLQLSHLKLFKTNRGY